MAYKGSNSRRGVQLCGPFSTGILLALAGLLAASCSARSPVAQPSSTTTASSIPAAQQAVITAWEGAERTVYGYQQQPVAPERAKLVAGDSAAERWPTLDSYFTGAALKSTTDFLTKTTLAAVNGPASYNLGHPTVTTMAASTASITSCIYDSGTTTASGQPAPTELAGGAGSGRGTWDLQLSGGSWKVASFRTTTVPKC